MDMIWHRNPSKSGVIWPFWRGWKKRITTQNRQKIER